MKILTKEEMKIYVQKLLPFSQIIEAKKIGYTYAVNGNVGDIITTYSTDKEGNEIIETIQTVSLDPKTKKPGWVLTKLDSNNKPVINKNGHLNQYIVNDSDFNTIYEPSYDGINLYKKKKIEKLIQLEEDIQFGTSFGYMTIMKGGYVTVTDLDEIYGISFNDFNDTYEVIEENNKKI